MLLSDDGMVAVLADFGLAVRLPPDSDKYIDTKCFGTPKFQSKEVVFELSWSSLQYILVICPVNILLLAQRMRTFHYFEVIIDTIKCSYYNISFASMFIYTTFMYTGYKIVYFN